MTKNILNTFQDYWNTITQVGVQTELRGQKKRAIRIVNHINLSFISVAIVCFFPYLLLGDWLIASAAFTAGVLTSIPIFLNKYYYHKASLLAFFFVHFLIYIGLSITVGYEGNMHIGCLFLFVAALVLFEKQLWKFIFMLLGILSFIFCEIWFEYSEPLFMPPFPLLNNIVAATIIAFLFYQLVSFYKKETQEANNALKDSQKHLQATVEGALDAVIFIDREAKILRWNKQAETIFGYAKQEAMGKYMPDLIIPKRYIKGHENGMKQWEKTGKGPVINQRIEIEARDKAGRVFPIELSITPLKVKNNTIFSAFLRDITGQKEYQENLLAANKSLQQFAGIAAHDLKAPLRTISSFVKLLAPNIPADDESQEFFSFITKSTTRMNRLLTDLMTYANAGVITVASETVDLNDTIEIVRQNLYATIQEHQAEITAPDLPKIEAHPTLVMQVFQNLIGNALKFQKPNEQPKIDILIEAQNTHWHISIKDNGIGMKQEFAEKIFEPFTRLHTQKAYEGSGIGLATCKKIVEGYGGKIWAEGVVGEGATFHFTLPK